MTSLRQQDAGLVCDCGSSLNCFLSSCHHPVKINVSGMKSRVFIWEPSTPAAHKGGWAHPTCSWHLRQSTGACQEPGRWGGGGRSHWGRRVGRNWANWACTSADTSESGAEPLSGTALCQEMHIFFLPCCLEGGDLALSCHVLNPLGQAALNPRRQSWGRGEPTPFILLHTESLSPAIWGHSAQQQLQWPATLLKLCMYWAPGGSSGFFALQTIAAITLRASQIYEVHFMSLQPWLETLRS